MHKHSEVVEKLSVKFNDICIIRCVGQLDIGLMFMISDKNLSFI